MSEPEISNHHLDHRLFSFIENRANQYWLLAFITLLAAVLRFYKLGEWSFWIDEIFTINRAQIHLSDAAVFLRSLPSTLWLPLSLILTEIFLKIMGVSEWSARLASALIGIASIPILYFTTRKLVGSTSAMILALLLAISPWHLFWSQNARFYTSLLLIYNLVAFAFFYAIEVDRPIYILFFYVLFYFAVSERLTAIFILPVILAYLVALWLFRFDRPPGMRKRNILLLIGPMFGLTIFDGFHFIQTGYSIISNVINVFGGQQFDDPLRLAVAIIFNIGLPVVSLGFIGGLSLLLQKSRVGLFLLLSAVLPVVILVILNPFMFTKDRYVFMTLPFWILLSAIAINQLISKIPLNGKLLAVGVLVIFLAEAAGTNLLYYRVNNGGRRDWKTAFEVMRNESQEGDMFVAWWPEFGPYYLNHEIIPWKDINPDIVMNSGKRYWFLVDSETIWGNLNMREWVINNAQLMEVLYLRMPEDDFNLQIYLYDPITHMQLK